MCILLHIDYTTDLGNGDHTSQQAEVYNKFVSKQIPSNLSILNCLTLREGSKVLDLGCATGNVTSVLVEAVGPTCQVIGVDPDKERIDIAKKSNVHPNVTYLVGDGENFPEDLYNLIFCNYVMPLIEDKEVVFHKVSQNLNPDGGMFLLITPTAQPVPTKEISRLMGPEGEAAVNRVMRFNYPPEVYDAFAEANGLKVTFKEEDVDHVVHPNVKSALDAWMGATHGTFDPAKADPEALQRFKEKYSGQETVWPIPVVRYIFTLK